MLRSRAWRNRVTRVNRVRFGDSAQRILDVAERLVQTRGFNGFSYADIAEALDVTKASLHYHFPSKADSGRRLIERYEKTFLAALEGIDADRRGAARETASAMRASTPTCCATTACACAACSPPNTPRCRSDEGGREALLRRKRALADCGARAGRKARQPRVQGVRRSTSRAYGGLARGRDDARALVRRRARFDTAAERLDRLALAVPT